MISDFLLNITPSIIASLIAALATLLGAVLSSYLAKKHRQDNDRHREELEKVAGALQAEETARSAAVVERVIERMPTGLSQEQLTELVTEITKRLHISAGAPVASAVENLINNYHEQALSQAKAQFWFSVVAATVGFAWILIAGTGITAENLASVTKTLPGVVMDAVAFLFFRQASETRQRATELYDRLRRDKQMSEAVELVSSIEDLRVRSAVKAQIALHMSGLKPNPVDLSAFLSSDHVAAEEHVAEHSIS
jgi:hypothetical protein